ncbi:DUF1572 family protein [Jeotgalibacillus aurantiacus]|uniref:DUF1572 family protein n=1 Tax=Jeotgalibacillus aurantiacus TaxID=2763266 RepID=UPI001D0B6E0A|nr:DUF1572 family protein [Jeotgalibacillus aurantiacus]
MSHLEEKYLKYILVQYKHLKTRADQGIDQLSEEEWFWKPGEELNSIAILMKHLSGNMHSRWLDFLTSDGEKECRNRDMEFVIEGDRAGILIERWESGWRLLFETIECLEADDLEKTVTLRGQPITVLQAIQTELSHISYHVGQILFLGKQIKDDAWTILSIPKNGLEAFIKKVKGD